MNSNKHKFYSIGISHWETPIEIREKYSLTNYEIVNIFNKAKSDLKHIEACALGLPIACQNISTYEHAPIKFNTGDEMMDQIENTLRDRKRYRSLCKKASQYVSNRWLEDDSNIDCYTELYQYNVGDPKRINISRYN